MPHSSNTFRKNKGWIRDEDQDTCNLTPCHNFYFIIYGHLSEKENVIQVPSHIRNNSRSLSHSVGIKEAVNSTTADSVQTTLLPLGTNRNY